MAADIIAGEAFSLKAGQIHMESHALLSQAREFG